MQTGCNHVDALPDGSNAKAPQRYRFVSGLDKSYSPGKRAHVLQPFLLERKKRAARRRKQAWTKPDRKQYNNFTSGCSPPHDTRNDEEDIVGLENLPLIRVLGAGRVDPFSTMVREPTTREKFLLDYYVRDILYHFKAPSNVAFHPPRDLCFGINIQSTAAIHSMYAYTATHLARRYGHPDREGREYRRAALQAINDAISDPARRFVDGTILAIIGMIHGILELEHEHLLPDQQNEVAAHTKGLRSLIAARGGFIVFCEQSSIAWMATWTDLTLFGELSAGWTPLSDHALLRPADILVDAFVEPDPPSSPFYYSFKTRLEEFTGAYRHFFWGTQERRRESQNERMDVRRGGRSSVCQLFRKGTPIHRLLTQMASGVAMPRVGVLFLFNIILWDHRDSLSFMLGHYFKRVRMMMVEQGLDIDGCVDQLMWLLVRNPQTHGVDAPERLWLLARLLRIYKRLSKPLQSRVEETLLGFLVSEDDDKMALHWTPECFHAEVMRDVGLS